MMFVESINIRLVVSETLVDIGEIEHPKVDARRERAEHNLRRKNAIHAGLPLATSSVIRLSVQLIL